MFTWNAVLVFVVGTANLIHTIAAVAEARLNICDSSNYRELSLLPEHVPVLAAFLAKCPGEGDGELPQDVRDLTDSLSRHILNILWTWNVLWV